MSVFEAEATPPDTTRSLGCRNMPAMMSKAHRANRPSALGIRPRARYITRITASGMKATGRAGASLKGPGSAITRPWAMLNTKMVTNSKWPVGRNDWGFATAISACGSERAASCSGRATSGRTQRKSTTKQPALAATAAVGPSALAQGCSR